MAYTSKYTGGQIEEKLDEIFAAIKGENVNDADWREATEEEKEAYEKSLIKEE